MKKTSKILLVILAAALLVGTLALAVFASADGIKGKFVVAGVGYETWSEAIEAADNTHTIYLNENVTLEKELNLFGAETRVRINLNGKTVSVADEVATAFVLKEGTKFTLSGSGTFENVSGLVSASGASTIKVEATGKNGIVVNHRQVAEDSTSFSTFRFLDGSSLDVSGFLTVNAYNGKRYIFNATSNGNTKGAAKLNIENAKILVPLPSKTPATDTPASVAQMISLSDNIDVRIIDSDLELYYGTLINAKGASPQKNVSSYKNGDHSWKENAAQGIVLDEPTINFVAKNSRFFSDYGKYSKKMAANGHNIGAGIMIVAAKMDAGFDNCRFYADWRPFTSDGNITGVNVNQHQLLFKDCHFDESPGDNAGSQFFIYGINYKILGGTWSHSYSMSAGSFYYLPLEDSEGNPTGQWIGGYMNNTLVNSEKTFTTTGVTSGWVDSTYTEPNSLKYHNVTLVIDGVARTFKAGYFTDMELYKFYVPDAAPDAPVDPDEPGDSTEPAIPDDPIDEPEKHVHTIPSHVLQYVIKQSDGNGIKMTGDYVFAKGDSPANVGTNPLSTLVIGFSTGKASSVISRGNGYVKFTDVATASSSYSHIQTPTGAAGSIITNNALVIEFDISSENGSYINQSLTFQGRAKIPRFDVNGTYLGYTNSKLADNAMDYSPSCTISIGSGKITFNGKSATLPQSTKEWARITAIVDFEDEGVAKEIEIDAYTKSGSTYTLVEGQKAKIQATKLTKYDVHLYVNGEYLSTVPYDLSQIGYGGYIPVGYEANFYIDGLRVFFSDTAGVEHITCYDNVRVSKYADADNVDLGLYDDEGNPVASLKGNEHFLIMVDNSTIKPDPVIVDGVEYEEDSDVIAAIKDGSVVELKRDMETAINVDEILKTLGLETMSFTIKTGKFNLPTIISANHGTTKIASRTYSVTPLFVTVDGVGYLNDSDAIAAIKDGSVVELGRDMKTVIDVEAILTRLGLENISFTVIPGKYALPAVSPYYYGIVASETKGAYTVAPIGIVVDGVRYKYDADAIAAIKNGSVVVLERDMMSTIDVDSIIASLSLEAIKFEIIPGKFTVPTVIASGHKFYKGSGEAYVVSPIGINVDGVEYGTDAEAIAAIKNGSVVEFNRDMKTAINVDEILASLGLETMSFKIIPGEFAFPGIISSSHKIVDYTGAFGGYAVVPADFGEVYEIYYSSEIFGVSGLAGFAAEGTLYPAALLTEEGEEVAYEGKLWSIIGWLDAQESATANGFYANSSLAIAIVPNYDSQIYFYEITVNGESEYVTDVLLTGIEEALAKGDVSVVLWQNVVVNSLTAVKGNLDIDLNGNEITFSGAEAGFKIASGTKFNVYSLCDGAKIEANEASTLLNVEYDRRRSGDIEINVSNVEINANGFVNYYDSYLNDSLTANDSYVYVKTFALNLDGVALTSTATTGAVITSALPMTLNAEGVDYKGLTTLLEILPEKRASVEASFKASSFVTPDVLVKVPGENRSVRFEDCEIIAPLHASYEFIEENKIYGKETITVGKNCSFSTRVEALLDSGLVFEEGLVAVPANAGDVVSYVNTLDAMALVYWIGADGNPIAEPNYNAPFGKPVEQFTWEEANEKLGLLEENDWYFVAFDNWDISEDFELTAGVNNVYPKWKAPEASISCLKMDLVAYTYFKLNLYLPEEAPEGVKLHGIYRKIDDGLDHRRDSRYMLIDGQWHELLETGEAIINEKNYSSYSVYPGAADASEPEYKVAFDLNGTLLVDTVNCGVPTYAETVMKNIMKDGADFDALSENDKVLAHLVMNMVRYANESYKLANATAIGAEKYEALLASYSDLLIDFDSIEFSDEELSADASALGTYMEGASFIFGSYQPSFVFKYRSEVLEYLVKPESADGRIYTWPEGNIGLFAVIHHESYNGDKSYSYIAPHVAYNDNGNGKYYVAPDLVAGTWGPMTEAYVTTIDMNVYNVTGVVNVELYSPEGNVVRGSYSLAVYIDHLAKTVNEAEALATVAREAFEDAKNRAEIAANEALKPENAPLKDKYEALAAEYQAEAEKQEAIALKNEAIISEYSSFIDASFSLYAFSLASQDYDRIYVK